MRDRLFLTGALRSDQNSAFGTKFQRVFYPKVSLSWQISDEDFFPHGMIFNHVNSLHLRLARGASGVQPGPNDALQTFSAGSASIKATDVPTETYKQIGNDSLRPERSTEWETGFDSRLFGSRVQFDVTYYSKLTKDALISAIIAPSLGSGATSQRANLGSVKNAGWEVTLGGQLVDRRQLGLDFHIGTSLNANKVVSLGSTPPQIAVTNWIVAGYPIRGIWAQPITGWNDKNHDGILTVDEVTRRGRFALRSGRSRDGQKGVHRPRHLPRLRRAAIPDDVHVGHRSVQPTPPHHEPVRLARRQHVLQPDRAHSLHAPELQRPVQPERVVPGPGDGGGGDLQSPQVARRLLPAGRVREMARGDGHARRCRTRIVGKTRARDANLVFSARNIHLWTKYRGTDPESDFTATGGGDAPSEFQTFAQPTIFQFRLNLIF